MGQLPRYLFDLRRGKGFSGAVEEVLCVVYRQTFYSPAAELKPKTYDEVSSLIGAGEESGWMTVHLVLESGRSAVFCLTSQSLPELICEDHRHTSSYNSFTYFRENKTPDGLKIIVFESYE